MSFALSSRDEQRLKGVHPHLASVIRRTAATSPVRFVVLEGLRTVERQRQLVKKGASKTMNSRHIKAPNGFGHAVDIAPVDDKGQVSWHWPLYHKLAPVVKAAAKAEGVSIEWGGDWKSFKDGPHWQLPWKQYPGSHSAVASAEPMTDKTEGEISGSRTLAGAGLSGVGVLGSSVSEAADQIQPLAYYSTALSVLFVALTLVGIGVVIYARLDDAGKIPWKR